MDDGRVINETISLEFYSCSTHLLRLFCASDFALRSHVSSVSWDICLVELKRVFVNYCVGLVNLVKGRVSSEVSVVKVWSIDGDCSTKQAYIRLEGIVYYDQWILVVSNVDRRMLFKLWELITWLIQNWCQKVTEEALCLAIVIAIRSLDLICLRVDEIFKNFGLNLGRSLAWVNLRHIDHIQCKQWFVYSDAAWESLDIQNWAMIVKGRISCCCQSSNWIVGIVEQRYRREHPAKVQVVEVRSCDCNLWIVNKIFSCAIRIW